MTGTLVLPNHLSDKARSIIIALLNRNPEKRLGGKLGAEEIKKHPWFNDINWDKVKNKELKPPKFTLEEIKGELLGLELFDNTFSETDKIEGWEYVNINAI